MEKELAKAETLCSRPGGGLHVIAASVLIVAVAHSSTACTQSAVNNEDTLPLNACVTANYAYVEKASMAFHLRWIVLSSTLRPSL